MRLERDTLLLLLSFIPVGYVLYAFYTFRTTGVWPLDIALQFSIPSTSVPSFLKPFDTIPEPVNGWIESGRHHWQIVVPGLGAGVIAGFLVVGVVADVIRVTIARFAARWRRRHPAPPVEDDVLSEPALPV